MRFVYLHTRVTGAVWLLQEVLSDLVITWCFAEFVEIDLTNYFNLSSFAMSRLTMMMMQYLFIHLILRFGNKEVVPFVQSKHDHFYKLTCVIPNNMES